MGHNVADAESEGGIMSGVASGISKVFKKVVKVGVKVLPIALAAGAIIFTAGAALGLPAMAGGWGGAVSSVTGALGLNSTLGGVLTGAVTQAGYGAALGGAFTALSGDGFTKGAQMGALAGAATGGIMGGLGMNTDPLSGMFNKQAGQVASAGSALAPTEGAATQGGVIQTGAASGVSNIGAAQAGAATVGPAATAAPTVQAASSGLGTFVEKNGALLGGALGGIGSGLMSGLSAKAKAEAEAKARKDLQDSYNGMPGYSYTDDGIDRPTPAQAFGGAGQTPTAQAPSTAPNYAAGAMPGRGRYEYDQSKGKIVYVQGSA